MKPSIRRLGQWGIAPAVVVWVVVMARHLGLPAAQGSGAVFVIAIGALAAGVFFLAALILHLADRAKARKL